MAHSDRAHLTSYQDYRPGMDVPLTVLDLVKVLNRLTEEGVITEDTYVATELFGHLFPPKIQIAEDGTLVIN